MRTNFYVAFGLGLVAAVVFASATTGPFVVRLVLFCITPLPIALAGLGWNWQTAAVAGGVSTGLITLLGGLGVAAIFFASQLAPTILLTYLAGLSRPLAIAAVAGSPPADTEAREFYPAGRLVLWAAAMGALMSVLVLLAIGGDTTELRRMFGEYFDESFKASLPNLSSETLTPEQMTEVADIAFALMPPLMSMIIAASLIFNVWLAGRITLASRQLQRPWPDLAALEFPTGTGLALAVALFASSLPGTPGVLAASVSGTLILAYLLLGLAVMHAVTRGRPWRPFALWGLYFALVFGNIWVAMIISLLGLAESFLRLRVRFPPPPAPQT